MNIIFILEPFTGEADKWLPLAYQNKINLLSAVCGRWIAESDEQVRKLTLECKHL